MPNPIRSGLLAVVTVTVTGLMTATNSQAASPVAAAAGDHPAAANPAVVSEWNAIADRTIFTENLTPIPSSALYFGFVHLAVYNAVVTIEGGYEQYVPQPQPRPQHPASTQAAAVAAAYRVLVHYFPASADNLATDYAASLGEVPGGPVRWRGVQVGRAAAAAIIALREDDGRDADKPLVVDVEPGVWRPTPDAFAPMAVPWLGFVDPLLLRRPTQLGPPGPDPITSRRYARQVREVHDYGALDGSLRNRWQTETALFYSDNAIRQYQAAMRGQATDRGLDIVEAARMFALVDSATADALIGCWRAKYDHAYWRPITAIREADTDGNPDTDQDADWTPLVPTPPYPDYVSGHACASGAVSDGLGYLFGAADVDLDVASAVTGTTRHYDTARQLNRQTKNARIWLGLHFRKAMTDGNLLGHRIASYAARTHFQPDH